MHIYRQHMVVTLNGVSIKLQNIAAKAATNMGGYMNLIRVTTAPSRKKGVKVIVKFETDISTGETRVVRVANT